MASAPSHTQSAAASTAAVPLVLLPLPYPTAIPTPAISPAAQPAAAPPAAHPSHVAGGGDWSDDGFVLRACGADIAAAVRGGHVTCARVTGVFLARIAAVNGVVNAVVEVNAHALQVR